MLQPQEEEGAPQFPVSLPGCHKLDLQVWGLGPRPLLPLTWVQLHSQTWGPGWPSLSDLAVWAGLPGTWQGSGTYPEVTVVPAMELIMTNVGALAHPESWETVKT